MVLIAALVGMTAALLAALTATGLLLKKLRASKPQIDKYVNDIQVLEEDLNSDELKLNNLLEKYPKDPDLIELIINNKKHKKLTSEMQGFGVLLQEMIKKGEEQDEQTEKILSETRVQLMENPEIMAEMEKFKDL